MDNVTELYEQEVARVNAIEEQTVAVIMHAILEYNQAMMEASTRLLEALNQASLEFQQSRIAPPKE